MMAVNKAIAVIGDINFPLEKVGMAKTLTSYLLNQGYDVRTGGNAGTENAFTMKGVSLYLPWPGFRTHRQAAMTKPSKTAYGIASMACPSWARQSNGSKSLMARNVNIILGADLSSPVQFILIYGREPLTEHARRIALTHEITTYNIEDVDADALLGLLTTV